MKPNGKFFVVRAVLLTLCAVGLSSVFGSAATVRGTFKLANETHWGRLLLAPGEYEFTVNDQLAGKMVTVRSVDSGLSRMIMAEGTSDLRAGTESTLTISKSPDGVYVQALSLRDSGVTLHYGVPKTGRLTKLAKSQATPTVASASGRH
jgi:hypothetical protein